MYWKALASHIDKSAWLEAQVRQLLQMANQQQNKFDMRTLVEAIDTVKQKITLLETNDQRLGMAHILLLSGWLCCLHVFLEQANTWPDGELQLSRINSGGVWYLWNGAAWDSGHLGGKWWTAMSGGWNRQRVEMGQDIPKTRSSGF